MFWGTRATNFSVYTTKMKGAGTQILGTGAKFKQVPCQKSCRVNRALGFPFRKTKFKKKTASQRDQTRGINLCALRDDCSENHISLKLPKLRHFE